MPTSAPAVLLVDPRADVLVLEAPHGLAVTAATSDTAARAYLAASTFEVLVVGASMPAGTGAALAAVSASLGHAVRLVEGAPQTGFADWLRAQVPVGTPRAEAPTSEATAASAVATSARDAEVAALESVSAELARVAHALNNPLAIIDGNAQLALELSRAMGVDPMVVSAIEDIQGGSQQLAGLFSEIADLRVRIDQALRG